MSEKEKRLLELMAEIQIAVFTENLSTGAAWFFPEYAGVKGYLGIKSPVFVALNPSYGRFPDKPCKFFYQQLKKYSFESSHITDIIKARFTGSEYSELKKDKIRFNSILDINIAWLRRELSIIGCNIKLVAIGRESYDILIANFPNVLELPHYSYVVRWGRQDIFNKGMQAIKVIVDKDK